jgi:hypothetical protein
MKILLACEESGEVRDRFTELGHDATSCDLQPSRIPGKHYQGSVFDIINDGWDMMIAFPPCTHLAVSGAKHFEKKRADGRQQEGIDFFMAMINAPIPRIAVENPIGIMSSLYRVPDQIIQPWYFGDQFQKTTCLWLKNLPHLYHNATPNLFDANVTHVGRGEFVTTPSGKKLPKWYSDNKSSKSRSKTFPGIAQAMATQWSKFILKTHLDNSPFNLVAP